MVDLNLEVCFQTLLRQAGIESKPISSGNPQSNGIIEQVHKTVGLILRVLVQQAVFTTREELEAVVDDALHTAIRAIRSASHHSLDNISPGALAFRRDMNLDIPLMADVLTLQQLRQRQIDHRLLRANAGRRSHDFQVGDQVLVKRMLNHSAQMEIDLSWTLSHYSGSHEWNCHSPSCTQSTSAIQHPTNHSLPIAGGSFIVWKSESLNGLQPLKPLNGSAGRA